MGFLLLFNVFFSCSSDHSPITAGGDVGSWLVGRWFHGQLVLVGLVYMIRPNGRQPQLYTFLAVRSFLMKLMAVIGYQLALSFWMAAFPNLARDTPELQAASNQLRDGSLSEEDHSKVDSLQRNRLANVAFYVSSCGEVVILSLS